MPHTRLVRSNRIARDCVGIHHSVQRRAARERDDVAALGAAAAAGRGRGAAQNRIQQHRVGRGGRGVARRRARSQCRQVRGIARSRIGGGVRDFRRIHCAQRTNCRSLIGGNSRAQQVRNGDGGDDQNDRNYYQQLDQGKAFLFAHGSISLLARRRSLQSLGVFCRSDFRFSPHVADCHLLHAPEVSDGALRFMKRGSTILHGAPLFQACTLPGPSPGLKTTAAGRPWSWRPRSGCSGSRPTRRCRSNAYRSGSR